jgi:microsomal dipeptidase-like Zn-dependent dipeptidase
MAAASQTDPMAGGEAMAFRRETLVLNCTTLLYAVDEPYASRLQEGCVDVTMRPDIFGTVENLYSVPYPKGLDQVRLLPNFTQGLMDRQYPRDQITAIMGGNWFRHFEQAVG